MKAIITLLLIPLGLMAQSDDSLATLYFKQAAAAGNIWQAPLYGAMLLVDPQSRITYSNTPDSAGTFTPLPGGSYKGYLPREVMIANTSINWQGQTWAVLLWPLPTDQDDRLHLMLHESFHRIQNKLHLPAHSPTIPHLATMNGRIYFLLELQALKAALSRPLDQRQPDLTQALLFRQKRQQLFPSTFPNERLLEMNEGLAEYTGMLLGRSPSTILQHLYDQVDSAGNRASLIRSMAYFTGPLYGYLLYERSPDWTKTIDSTASFPSLICHYYHLNTAGKSLHTKPYHAASIIHTEKAKEKVRLQQIAAYTQQFLHEPVLTITLLKMSIVFNPNTLFDLGTPGTIYPTAEIKDTWGTLRVTSGGLLMKDWKQITLPAKHIQAINDRIIQGPGWELNLLSNWRVVQKDRLHAILVNED